MRERFAAVRRASEALASELSPEDQMVQSMPDASPTKWHLAHTTWFFETFILSEQISKYQPFDNDFRFLYNSYYKQLGSHPNRATRGTFSRPPHARVLQYRQHVNERMAVLLDQGVTQSVADLIVLGLNHEQQHQELIVTDIKHAFWSNPLRPAYEKDIPEIDAEPGPVRWNSFDGGVVDVGYNGAEFAFDNELPRHQCLLRPFRMASRLVTNSEFLDFIDDGGYRRPELWLSDGWDTVLSQGWQAPMYWERRDDRWRTFTLAGMRDVQRNEPVCHVSFYEADAFARWSRARLPLEHEWEVAARDQKITGNFVETGRLHPAPAGGMSQMYGDVWEWTASPYVAYPGFKPGAGAIGEYNGKFMCNQFVLRGGSTATPQSHIRATYRNFFPPSTRWQFMGIRLVANEF